MWLLKATVKTLLAAVFVQKTEAFCLSSSNVWISRRTTTSTPTQLKAQTHDEASYEAALAEMESDVLYGNTPKMCDLDQLAGWVRRERLDLSPKYQRGYVWKEDRASRLIVTALCNRIVPGIVLHEVQKGTYEVVDGKQRLTTLLSFYLAGEDPKLFQKLCQQHERFHKCSDGLFSTLRKLDENYEDLEGLTYDQLSQDRQFALQSYTVPCTIIPLGTPKEEVFSCYEDINSGGEDLTAQQLRRAVFYGDYIELLDKLAVNPDFQCIRDPKGFRANDKTPATLLCPKESDRELILRAFAWERNYNKYKRPLKTFLNAELQHYETMERGNPGSSYEELQRRSEEFVFVMKVWRNVFSEEDGAFRAWTKNRNGKWQWSPSITVGLWDVLYSVLVELRHSFPTEPIYIQNKDALKGAIQDLFESGKLEVSSTVTITKFLARRDTIRSALLEVLQKGQPGKFGQRRFVNIKSLKEDLFRQQEGLCSICGNSIDAQRLEDGDYVHLDHIVPFSKGGLSSAENAGLAHAACNLSKGARVES